MSRQNNYCDSLKVENRKVVSRIWTNMLFGGKTQCTILGLNQDAQVTTVKLGLQISKHVFKALRPRWEGQQRTVGSDSLASLIRLLCEPDSHKFQSLQVKTPMAMHSSMSSYQPNPLQHNSANTWLLADQAGLCFSSTRKGNSGSQLQLSKQYL